MMAETIAEKAEMESCYLRGDTAKSFGTRQVACEGLVWGPL